mmetsp:Transcript_32017/g.94322  ORF Transcript_32017/g.94322 Transcript_32017/m.94322 type:complete len:186 (+) Transcript_32017:143-700(+)
MLLVLFFLFSCASCRWSGDVSCRLPSLPGGPRFLPLVPSVFSCVVALACAARRLFSSLLAVLVPSLSSLPSGARRIVVPITAFPALAFAFELAVGRFECHPHRSRRSASPRFEASLCLFPFLLLGITLSMSPPSPANTRIRRPLHFSYPLLPFLLSLSQAFCFRGYSFLPLRLESLPLPFPYFDY